MKKFILLAIFCFEKNLSPNNLRKIKICFLTFSYNLIVRLKYY